MKRSELIKLVTLATGSLLSVPLMNSLLVSCKDVPLKNDGDYILQFFNEEDFLFVKTLAYGKCLFILFIAYEVTSSLLYGPEYTK